MVISMNVTRRRRRRLEKRWWLGTSCKRRAGEKEEGAVLSKLRSAINLERN